MIDIYNLRSNFDNCILYNALIKMQCHLNLMNMGECPEVGWKVQYFINFAQNGLQSQVDEYYRRSERIISKMRDLGVDNDETWIEIDQNLIAPILSGIDNESGFVEAYRKLQEALTTLESKYEVN
ncbi:MAG: hypothetical protein VW270_15270 [Candidatus Poseidoniales archaeon]